MRTATILLLVFLWIAWLATPVAAECVWALWKETSWSKTVPDILVISGFTKKQVKTESGMMWKLSDALTFHRTEAQCAAALKETVAAEERSWPARGYMLKKDRPPDIGRFYYPGVSTPAKAKKHPHP